MTNKEKKRIEELAEAVSSLQTTMLKVMAYIDTNTITIREMFNMLERSIKQND